MKDHESVCLQIQQKKFPGVIQEIFYKIPVDFYGVLVCC